MPRVQKKAKVRRAANAIMRIPAPQTRAWELSTEQVDLLKKTICKGATDDELKLCLEIARRHKLDPFRGQIWFVPRRNDGQKQWVAVVGINGLLHVAARDHHDFGSIEEPEYGPLQEISGFYYTSNREKKDFTIKVPEWARVKGWKKGLEHPVVATVYFEEIYPSWVLSNSPMVRQMPRHMLGKVATAHVVRKAWPSTDGMYIREEFQGPPQYTDSGRAINYRDAPSAAPQLDDEARHGHEAGSVKAKMAEETLRKVEEADRMALEERAAIVVESAPAEAKEIWPKAGKPEKRTAAESGSAKTARGNSAAEPQIAEGTITHSVAGMAGKIPVRDVSMVIGKKKPTFRCFDRKLFEHLDRGLGKEAALMMKKHGDYWNIVGIIKVGAQHFESDGKTPCLSVDREPGMLNFGNGR